MVECWLCLRVVGRSGGEWADFDSTSDRSDLSSPSSGISSKDTMPRCEASSSSGGVAIAVMSNQREDGDREYICGKRSPVSGSFIERGGRTKLHWRLKL